jgi:hypothetical protein
VTEGTQKLRDGAAVSIEASPAAGAGQADKEPA